MDDKQLLIELCRCAYWYGERTGDYDMTELFDADDEGMKELFDKIKQQLRADI